MVNPLMRPARSIAAARYTVYYDNIVRKCRLYRLAMKPPCHHSTDSDGRKPVDVFLYE
jgi:hypothetical protein